MEKSELSKFTTDLVGTNNHQHENVISIESGELLEESENGNLRSISMEKVLRFNKNRISNEAIY